MAFLLKFTLHYQFNDFLFLFYLFTKKRTHECVQLHRDGGWGKGVYITQHNYKIKLQYNSIFF
jgi:hypothetical protein